jgi:hypothetical protein
MNLQPVLLEQPVRNWPHGDKSPLEVVRQHFRGCFVGGLASSSWSTRVVIDHLGDDLFMAEADFPHCDSSYPDTRSRIADVLEGLPAESQLRLRQGNAIDWFGLDSLVTTSAVAGAGVRSSHF